MAAWLRLAAPIALAIMAGSAAAQPAPADTLAPTIPATSPADADSIFAIFESVCLSGGETPAGFETAAWSDFPPATRLLNTYGYQGTFLRRAEPETWIARTQAGAHMPLGVERRCGIAARGIETAGIVERLTRRAKADGTSEIGGGPLAMTLIAGRDGVFDVTRAEDGWVIVRSMEFLIRADMVPRRYRKGKRN